MNSKQPFYVDVGTSVVAIRCASNHDVIERYDHVRHPYTLDVAKDICDRMNRAVEIHNSGDCAKLRKALVEARKVIKAMGGYWATETLPIIDAALSAPPRNCDVGTANEQAERYGRYCDKFTLGGMHCETCPCCGKIQFGKCEFAWAQMPYKEEGAK